MFLIRKTISAFLYRYRYTLHWLHVIFTYCALIVFPFVLSIKSPISLIVYSLIFVFSFIGAVQNIGLMHVHFHQLPPGRVSWVRPFIIFLYFLGGLNYRTGLIMHHSHHNHLGTALDPDRGGYFKKRFFLQRLFYLFLVGPLRTSFNTDRRITHSSIEIKKTRLHTCAIFLTHSSLFVFLGICYIPWFTGLLLANILGNLREMAEHEIGGGAALINVKTSFWGILLFGGPGFWHHGTHHQVPSVHYFSLPQLSLDSARSGMPSAVYDRDGYWKYLVTGN